MPRKAPKRTAELQPPIGGVVLAYAYQNQAPFTTPDALNVRPQDVSELRARIGTRPGMEKAFEANVGPGDVRLMATVQWISSGAIVSTLLVSAAGVCKRSTNAGVLATVSGALSSSQLIHAVDLSQKLYIADWDPDATISGAARVPKVFDPSAASISSITASAGTVPKGCPAIARYRGRIVLAGARDNPHLVYGSRINDATDWDTGADVGDAARSWVVGAEDAFAIGQPVTALIATSDQCMIVGCAASLWIMRNDPTSGGSLNNLSPEIGIVSHGAWCQTPEGAIVFLSHNGLYMTYGGCADHRPEPLSRDRLPEALLNLSQHNMIINLAFDIYANGVLIMVTPINDSYSTGTVEIVNGVVTLTGGTFPAAAGDGYTLVVNGSNYSVASRDSGTQLTLDDLTLDVTAGAAYNLVSPGTADEHYFFDWKNKGFWPADYDWKNEATCLHAWKNFSASETYTTRWTASKAAFPAGTSHTISLAHQEIANESTILIGCRDGYIRWHRTDAADDDGNEISSHMVYGPLGFGRGFYDCTIDAIHGTLANGSGDIRWTLQAGNSPEQALIDPHREDTNVWAGEYLSQWSYPRLVGSDHYVKLSDVDGSVWTIERVGLIISERGQTREG